MTKNVKTFLFLLVVLDCGNCFEDQEFDTATSLDSPDGDWDGGFGDADGDWDGGFGDPDGDWDDGFDDTFTSTWDDWDGGFDFSGTRSESEIVFLRQYSIATCTLSKIQSLQV